MNLKFLLNSFRRRTLSLVLVLGLAAAMLPTAAFASGGYGNQGRAYNPGPHQSMNHSQHNNNPGYNNRNYRNNNHNNYGNNHNNNRNNNYGNNHNYNNNNHNYGNNNYGNNNHMPYNQGQHPNGQCDTSYTVRDGDTLSSIAVHYHMSVDRLARANNIHNSNHIVVGQVLCIPCY